MALLDPEDIILANLVMLVYFGFWLYALIDMIRSDFRDQNQKLIWALFLLCIPVLGTLFYLSMSARIKKGSKRKFNPGFSNKNQI